uniref:Uncharacterized protein n=1 Tax=Liparis tanakae TaxID=230148 RepID=A0A4Z2H4F0_9TELE|nr:hypothetical protein EYF80_029495 [Liparis tanakae]
MWSGMNIHLESGTALQVCMDRTPAQAHYHSALEVGTDLSELKLQLEVTTEDAGQLLVMEAALGQLFAQGVVALLQQPLLLLHALHMSSWQEESSLPVSSILRWHSSCMFSSWRQRFTMLFTSDLILLM